MIWQFALAALALLVQPGQEPAGPRANEAREATRSCLDMSAIVSRQAEDARTLRFQLIGGRVYRNRLPGRCPGLGQAANGFGALAFEIQGGHLCRGDRVRVVDTSSNSTTAYRNAIPCPLGDFVPVSNTSGEAARQ